MLTTPSTTNIGNFQALIAISNYSYLNIVQFRIPVVSINNNEQKVVPYPENEEITVEKMMKWLTKFVKGQLDFKQTGFGDIIDADIKYMLQSTKQLTRAQFVEEVFEDELDVFLFIYSSAVEDET